MPTLEQILSTIESVHAAGLDGTQWPRALAALANTVGGNAASIEVLDQQKLCHREMYSYGLPGAEEIAFREDFHEINIRLRVVGRQKLHELTWDYMVLDEAAMRRAPFYTEIMPPFDIRYFVGGILLKNAEEFAGIAVHRSPRMGHVQRDGIAMMQTLVPHVRQAFDVMRRLSAAEKTRNWLEGALDSILDGVALISADGSIVYVNSAFAAVARRADGIAIRKGGVDITDARARKCYTDAIAAVLRLRSGDAAGPLAADVMVPRRNGGPPYLLSVRPLVDKERDRCGEAIAMIFVRDLASAAIGATTALRERFGFTAAEAALAEALQSGVTAADYARTHALSVNTVYTHLRHLREKTGCSRMPELIHKLNELRLPLRLEALWEQGR
jgi:DNA-binding CsgD family transcriptional regulator/PAS domain-containing protein